MRHNSSKAGCRKRTAGSLHPAGYTARLEQLKAIQNAKRLDEIERMLDEAGVPEWVENSDSSRVPSNAPHCRLKREMKENLEYARRYNTQALPRR